MVHSNQRTYAQVGAGIDFDVSSMCFFIPDRKKMQNQTLYLCLSDGMACERLPAEYGSLEGKGK